MAYQIPSSTAHGGALTNTNKVLAEYSQRYGLKPDDWQAALGAYHAKHGTGAEDFNWWGDASATRAYLQGIGYARPNDFGGLWNEYSSGEAFNPDAEKGQQREAGIAGLRDGARLWAKELQGGTTYSPIKWSDAEIDKLAEVMMDVGQSKGWDALPKYMNAMIASAGDAGANQQWWGPQAWISNLASNFGLDATKYVDKAALEQQQKVVGDAGMHAQATTGKADNLGEAMALGALALGFAGALGAFGGGASALGEVGAAAAAAGDAGFLAAGGTSTAATGGAFVGSGGLLGGTGNAIADAALNGAVRGGLSSALTGGDVGRGILSGGVSGGIGSTLPDLGSAALNNAAQGAVSGGVGAAVNGGDILTGAAAGGAASGVGTLVREAVPTSIGGNALTNAVAGGAAGAVGSAIAGGDVGTGLIRGAVTGGTTGALTDAGADPLVAGAAGTAAGGLITAPTPDAGTPAAQQQQTATTIGAGLGFSVVLPQFQDTRRRDMQWGSRLSGG